jgi:rod shape-determining protein MreB
MAAAIGAGLPIEEPQGQMVIDIGGGTTEVAILSLGGIVVNRSIRIAGDEMDQAILNFARLKYSLLLGESTAEELKIAIGSAYPLKREMQAVVRGRDLGTGLPKSLRVTSVEVREALSPVVRKIVETISDVLEETPPELVSDILGRGVTMAGGGSLLRGIDKLIGEETKMPVWVTDEPMAAVVRGCGKVLDDLDLLRRVRVTGGLR